MPRSRYRAAAAASQRQIEDLGREHFGKAHQRQIVPGVVIMIVPTGAGRSKLGFA
jgi:hypothetical protein